MKICIFTEAFLPRLGGTELSLDRLARGLSSRGHDVFVLTNRTPLGEPKTPYEIEWFVRPRLRRRFPVSYVPAIWRTYRHRPFDVMLAVSGHPCGFAAVHFRRLKRFGLVVNARGRDLYPSHIETQSSWAQAITRRGYQGADRIIALSRYLETRIKEWVGEPLPPIDRIANGIELSAIDQSRKMASPGTLARDFPELIERPFVLHLARLSTIKRQHEALVSLASVADTLEWRNILYVFAGDGPIRVSLEEQSRSLGVDRLVRFVGSRTGNEKAWLLREAMLMVSSSQEEGMPNTLIECMANGLPVLVSDIDPHIELLEKNDWGMTYPLGDSAALGERLVDMIGSDLAPRRTAALKTREEFSIERMLDRYEGSFVKVLADI